MYINTYTVDVSNMMVSNSYKKEGLGRQMVFKWSQMDRSNSFLGMAWVGWSGWSGWRYLGFLILVRSWYCWRMQSCTSCHREYSFFIGFHIQQVVQDFFHQQYLETSFQGSRFHAWKTRPPATSATDVRIWKTGVDMSPYYLGNEQMAGWKFPLLYLNRTICT